MSQVGTYKGYQWHRKPVCEVMPHVDSKQLWYFLLDEKGDYTGDHFQTLTEMEACIDAAKGVTK